MGSGVKSFGGVGGGLLDGVLEEVSSVAAVVAGVAEQGGKSLEGKFPIGGVGVRSLFRIPGMGWERCRACRVLLGRRRCGRKRRGR